MEPSISLFVLTACGNVACFWIGYWLRGYQERKYMRKKNRPQPFNWED